MKSREKETRRGVFMLILEITLIIALVIVEIHVWTTYGKMPIDEVPMWALWLMFGGKN